MFRINVHANELANMKSHRWRISFKITGFDVKTKREYKGFGIFTPAIFISFTYRIKEKTFKSHPPFNCRVAYSKPVERTENEYSGGRTTYIPGTGVAPGAMLLSNYGSIKNHSVNCSQCGGTIKESVCEYCGTNH